MIEIVFGESACGSLKIAQTYGKGKYRGSAVSIFMRHEDGSKFGGREPERYRRQVREYLALLRQMGYTETEGYLWYVKLGRIEKVEE